MSSVNLLASLVKIDSLTYNDLAELDAMDDMHAVPDQATPADRAWAAEAFAADGDGEPCDEVEGGDWDAFDDFVVECGPDPEIDFHVMMAERWSLAPNGIA